MYDSGGVSADYGSNEQVYTPFQCQVGAPMVTFTQLEIDGTSPACSTDSLTVYNAVKSSSTYGYTVALKSTYCGSLTGTSLPSVIGSAAGTLLMVFTSDSNTNKAGYSANFECFLVNTYSTAFGN